MNVPLLAEVLMGAQPADQTSLPMACSAPAKVWPAHAAAGAAVTAAVDAVALLSEAKRQSVAEMLRYVLGLARAR